MRARVKTPSAEDHWKCRTGFREIKTKGRLFLLNGERLVMNGVCRHDTWKDQGFTLSRRQQEQDMRMIKAMGCNFVRLVHYPHDRRIVELADEIGLIVSEEPGFWNMDFDKMPGAQVDLGCKILEQTIRRDWNSPAVCVWFLGNECTFPGELSQTRARRSATSLTRFTGWSRLPILMESFLTVKNTFDEAGLDFYDWHAYEYDEQKFHKFAESFGPDKPLDLQRVGMGGGQPRGSFLRT